MRPRIVRGRMTLDSMTGTRQVQPRSDAGTRRLVKKTSKLCLFQAELLSQESPLVPFSILAMGFPPIRSFAFPVQGVTITSNQIRNLFLMCLPTQNPYPPRPFTYPLFTRRGKHRKETEPKQGEPPEGFNTYVKTF